MNNKLSLVALALAAATALTAVAPAQAAEGPWLIRARVVNLDAANKDSTGLNLSINNKVLPEVDITYFFTPHIAAELVLTYPQKQDVRSGGTKIGSFKHLPPTLTAQYHFLPEGGIRPYVGAGVNYTLISAVDFTPGVNAALKPGLDSSSFGLALQAGVDIKLDKNLYLNFDIKKVQIKTDVSSYGTKVGTFKVDPLLVGVGLGWRF